MDHKLESSRQGWHLEAPPSYDSQYRETLREELTTRYLRLLMIMVSLYSNDNKSHQVSMVKHVKAVQRWWREGKRECVTRRPNEIFQFNSLFKP